MCSILRSKNCELSLADFNPFSLEPPQQPAGRELSASSPKTTPKSAPVGSSCGTELNGFVESTSRIGKGEDGPAATAVSQPRPAIVITRGEDDESNGDSVTVTTAAAATRHHQKVASSIINIHLLV